MPVEIESPFPEFAVPRIWDWVQTFRSKVCDDYSPSTREALVEHTLAQLRVYRSWAVLRDGDIGGIVLWQPYNPVNGAIHVIFKRAFWGRATTETALQMVFREIFESGVNKISASFYEDNHALRALAKALGAKREGWFEAQTIRNGKPVAMDAVAIFKDRFYDVISQQSVRQQPEHKSELVDNADVHLDSVGSTVTAREQSGERSLESGSDLGPAPATADGGGGTSQPERE